MKYVLASVALIVSGLVLGAVAAEKPSGDSGQVVISRESDSQEIAAINKRIGELQAELDRLKGQVKALEVKPRLFTIPVPPRKPADRLIPPNWERREFNGQEFYIVPLGKEPDAASR